MILLEEIYGASIHHDGRADCHVFFSYYYRISPAVIAPYLTQEFSLGAERLGFLASIFFYVFAFAQFPLGPALDSIGTRTVISTLSAIGALGSLIFALAPSFTICLFGRALLGLGMSCMYMGTLMVVAIWYPPRSFALLAGMVSALGNTGALTAAVPLALLAESVGWRTSFIIFAGINSLLALSTRYIHLNPVRAGVVQDMKALSKYPWTGNSVLMDRVKRDWQDTDTVLAYFGKRKKLARFGYERFVRDGVGQGRRPELWEED